MGAALSLLVRRGACSFPWAGEEQRGRVGDGPPFLGEGCPTLPYLIGDVVVGSFACPLTQGSCCVRALYKGTRLESLSLGQAQGGPVPRWLRRSCSSTSALAVPPGPLMPMIRPSPRAPVPGDAMPTGIIGVVDEKSGGLEIRRGEKKDNTNMRWKLLHLCVVFFGHRESWSARD